MQEAYLLLGTNIGDRTQNLRRCRQMVATIIGPIKQASSTYISKAWGVEDQPDFLNQVLLVRTNYYAHTLLDQVNQIESLMGRVRLKKWGTRIIDVDILYMFEEGEPVSIASDRLTIPHIGIPDRKFTLLPLVELSPNLMHPVLHKTQSVLLSECADPLPARKFESIYAPEFIERNSP